MDYYGYTGARQLGSQLPYLAHLVKHQSGNICEVGLHYQGGIQGHTQASDG